jgi:hypothetical protein
MRARATKLSSGTNVACVAGVSDDPLQYSFVSSACAVRQTVGRTS